MLFNGKTLYQSIKIYDTIGLFFVKYNGDC